MAVIGAVGGALWLQFRAPVRDRDALGVLGNPLVALLAGAVLIAVGFSLEPLMDHRTGGCSCLAVLDVDRAAVAAAGDPPRPARGVGGDPDRAADRLRQLRGRRPRAHLLHQLRDLAAGAAQGAAGSAGCARPGSLAPAFRPGSKSPPGSREVPRERPDRAPGPSVRAARGAAASTATATAQLRIIIVLRRSSSSCSPPSRVGIAASQGARPLQAALRHAPAARRPHARLARRRDRALPAHWPRRPAGPSARRHRAARAAARARSRPPPTPSASYSSAATYTSPGLGCSCEYPNGPDRRPVQRQPGRQLVNGSTPDFIVYVLGSTGLRSASPQRRART